MKSVIMNNYRGPSSLKGFLLFNFLLIIYYVPTRSFMMPQQSAVVFHHGVSERNARISIALREGEEQSSEGKSEEEKSATKLSLEEKMKNWEASEEELKAASLGGQVPQRSDGFDIGLYVAFPFMIIACLLFLAFPFIAGNLDVSSVGPPPTS